MSLGFVSQQPSTKNRSLSCHNCERLTIIEGETVCFRGGEIIRLHRLEDEEPSKLILSCDGWQAKWPSKINIET